jgi:uncharacterized protein YjbJ (UPF0337 family)
VQREGKESIAMDKDRVAGSAKEAKGAVKEAVGKMTGDAKLQADGQADKSEGKLQNAVGGAKDAVRERAEKVMCAFGFAGAIKISRKGE